MSKVIYKKIDKKTISQLPIAFFRGRIEVILNETEAEKAVNYLLSRNIVGVDTETRPCFRKGVRHDVALLQAATDDICFLFRLNFMGVSPSIIRFLEDTDVLKVGLSWHDDLHMLHKSVGFTPGYFVDIQSMVKSLGVEDISLQKLYANMFGMKIQKRQQLSNWERDVLTDKQKLYAATDAWACIMLYREIQRLEASGDYVLCDVEEVTEK